MKLSQALLTSALAAIVAFGVTHLAPAPATQVEAKKETAFERVMRTNTLRCGYVVLPPQLSRDPNTKELSGVSYDLVMEAAKRLNLKVDWAEEVTFMSYTEGLKTGRYDAFCLAAYRWPPGARALEYSTPLYRSTTEVYVRADDHRFDSDFNAINTPNVKVAIIDGGEASAFIREAVFPQSGIYSLPITADVGMLLESLVTQKADVALGNPLMYMPYLVSSPGKIRRVEGHLPLRSYSHALSFAKGEHDMASMFNVVIEEMRADGTIDKTLDKYEAIPNSFVRVKEWR